MCLNRISTKDIDQGRPQIVCTRMIESGTCDNRRRYYLDEIERMVVGGLRAELGTREAVAYFVHCYNEERRRSGAGSHDSRKKLTAELETVDRQIVRAVAAIIDDRITREEADVHLPALRVRRGAIAAQLASIEEPAGVITLRPAAVASYLRDLDRLADVVNQDLAEGDDVAAKAIRGWSTRSLSCRPSGAGRPGSSSAGAWKPSWGPVRSRKGPQSGCQVVPGARTIHPPPTLTQLNFTLHLGSAKAA